MCSGKGAETTEAMVWAGAEYLLANYLVDVTSEVVARQLSRGLLAAVFASRAERAELAVARILEDQLDADPLVATDVAERIVKVIMDEGHGPLLMPHGRAPRAPQSNP